MIENFESTEIQRKLTRNSISFKNVTPTQIFQVEQKFEEIAQ